MIVKKLKAKDGTVRYIIDTNHSIDRFYQRYRDIEKETILETIKNGMAVILTKYKDRNGSYLIHSKESKIGVIIVWRPEFKTDISRTKINNAVVVTILPPKGRHFTTDPKDVEILVEKNIAEQLRGYINNNRRLLEEKNFYYENMKAKYHSMDIGNGIDKVIVTFWEGQIYDVSAIVINVN